MKKITRMIFFSSVALYSTPFIIKGWQLKGDFNSFIITALILAFFYYFIVPLTKIILLPLNIITLGIVSLVVYLFLFNYVINRFGLVSITPWLSEETKVVGLTIPEIEFNYLQTLISSAVIYSTIVNLLDNII